MRGCEVETTFKNKMIAGLIPNLNKTLVLEGLRWEERMLIQIDLMFIKPQISHKEQSHQEDHPNQGQDRDSRMPANQLTGLELQISCH